MDLKRNILFIGTDFEILTQWAAGYNTEVISSLDHIDILNVRWQPDLIVFDNVLNADIKRLRKSERLLFVPVLIISQSFKNLSNLNSISELPRVMICNTAVAKTEAFMNHINKIVNKKAKVLPARSGAFVKYTILYINKNISKPFTRTQLSEHSGIVDDYLTRLFKSETGLVLWDYVTLCRLSEAYKLILETSEPLNKICVKCGYEDAAYFNRIFRKYYGYAPGDLRKR